VLDVAVRDELGRLLGFFWLKIRSRILVAVALFCSWILAMVGPFLACPGVLRASPTQLSVSGGLDFPCAPDAVVMRPSVMLSSRLWVSVFPFDRRLVVVGRVQPALVVPGDPAEDRRAPGRGCGTCGVDQLDLSKNSPSLSGER
jgi:hypothetical protein